MSIDYSQLGDYQAVFKDAVNNIKKTPEGLVLFALIEQSSKSFVLKASEVTSIFDPNDLSERPAIILSNSEGVTGYKPSEKTLQINMYSLLNDRYVSEGGNHAFTLEGNLFHKHWAGVNWECRGFQ